MQSLRRLLSAGCLALVAAAPIGAESPPIQEVVTGIVVSARTGQPLAGAQVVVEGTGQGVATNSSGRFLIPGISGATVTLRVVLILSLIHI